MIRGENPEGSAIIQTIIFVQKIRQKKQGPKSLLVF